MLLNTRLNRSGRSHAAVKAQIAPLLAPPMDPSTAFVESLMPCYASIIGKNSSMRNRA